MLGLLAQGLGARGSPASFQAGASTFWVLPGRSTCRQNAATILQDWESHMSSASQGKRPPSLVRGTGHPAGLWNQDRRLGEDRTEPGFPLASARITQISGRSLTKSSQLQRVGLETNSALNEAHSDKSFGA